MAKRDEVAHLSKKGNGRAGQTLHVLEWCTHSEYYATTQNDTLIRGIACQCKRDRTRRGEGSTTRAKKTPLESKRGSYLLAEPNRGLPAAPSPVSFSPRPAASVDFASPISNKHVRNLRFYLTTR